MAQPAKNTGKNGNRAATRKPADPMAMIRAAAREDDSFTAAVQCSITGQKSSPMLEHDISKPLTMAPAWKNFMAIIIRKIESAVSRIPAQTARHFSKYKVAFLSDCPVAAGLSFGLHVLVVLKKPREKEKRDVLYIMDARMK